MQLHNAVAEMEKEKFELQKRHTETIQELLEDTNVRLNKMEGDYMVQTQSTVSDSLFSSHPSCFPCPHPSLIHILYKFVTKFKEKALLSSFIQ